MRIDAEKGEGVDLAKQFNVRGYPTTVFVDSEGEEVDRIVGYLPTDEFLTELKRINKGENTYSSLQQRVEENPEDIEALKSLANKIEQRDRQSTRARDLWKKIAEIADPGSQHMRDAQFNLASFEANANQNPEPLLEFSRQHPESRNALQAKLQVMRIYREKNEYEKEAAIFKEVVNSAVDQGNTDVNMLNSYAWRMAELDMNLNDALDKIQIAVEQVEGAPDDQKAQVKDTHAEVLWKLGQQEKAVAVIDECIQLQPKDNYYKEQKAKFQATG